MSAVKYIRDNCKNVTPFLYVPDFFLDVAKNLVPNISIRGFSKKEKYKNDNAAVQTQCKQHDTLGTHLVDHAFSVLVNKQVEIEDKNYCKLNTSKIDIKKFNLPDNYVVITTGFTALVREWPAKSVNETVDYIISKGYNVVFLGNKIVPVKGCADAIRGHFNEEINFSKGISLIDKTNLLEAGKIISQSKCIVGLDNGLLHLAGTTDVPIVAGFTTVNPLVRLPYRHNELGWSCFPVVPDECLKCKFCQSEWALVYDWDFRYCFYDDYACKFQLTGNKFIEQLEKIL